MQNSISKTIEITDAKANTFKHFGLVVAALCIYSALYGNDCRRLKLKNTDSEFASLFITQVIRMQNKAFSYSRKLGTGRLENLKIMLPVTGSGEPDYDFMESFGRKMMSNKYHQYLAFNATPHANHHCKNAAVR